MDDKRCAVKLQRHTAVFCMDCPAAANAVPHDDIAMGLEDMLCLCLPSRYPWFMMNEII